MTVTIVICTHRRPASLHRTLNSVFLQAREVAAEIIVVDNTSSGETRAVASRFESVRYIREERLGLCHARNRGWRAASGPIVAFLDDDAVAAPDWLSAMLRAFSTNVGAGCVGGAVVPEWEIPAPSWLSRSVSLGLTIVDWPGGARNLTDLGREWLVGTNLACRVEALKAVGGFHPWLDRRGSRLLSSGDVFLERLLMRRGYACVYEPAMCVRHRVPATRLTRSWFRRRYFWQGVSDAVMDIIEYSPSRGTRTHDALTRSRALLRHPRQLVALLRRTDDSHEFEQQCWTWIALGHVAGLLGVAGR